VGLLWKTAAGEEIAVVEAEEEGVAAIFGQGSSDRWQNQKKKKNQQGKTRPTDLALQSAGLCFSHWNFCEEAWKSERPCSWQGNLAADDV
jgi:hypothetical protein